MRRILVVDDDRHVRLAIAAWLRKCGFRVAIADGGANGLAALDDTRFDLMVVDVLTPDMRGFEPIRLFHQRAPTAPRIAISGYAFSGAEAGDPVCLALGLGATRCLRKPFRLSTLLGLIDECLSEAEPHRRHVATLSAVANVLSGQRAGATASNINPISILRGPLRAELPDAGLCRLRRHYAGGKRRGLAPSPIEAGSHICM